VLQGVFLSITFAALINCSRKKLFTFQDLRSLSPGILLFFIYYTLVCFSVAYPEGGYRDVLPESANNVTGYPIDNLIPYNVSRYFVERIDPRSIEVVPTWQFTERGPLAGMLHAVVSISLGIQETSHWLSATAGGYFVYQAHMSFLNVSALFGLWLFVRRRLGSQVAQYVVLLAGTTSFIFLNSLFSWPKLFMSYFILLAFEFVYRTLGRRTGVDIRDLGFIGFLFGLAALAHEISLLYFLPCLLVLLATSLKRANFFPRFRFGKLIPPTISLIAFFWVLSPWIVSKRVLSIAESRLLHLHVFCVQDANIKQQGFLSALSDYIARDGFSGIFWKRLSNVVYPFDVSEILPLIGGRASQVYWWARSSASLAPYHYVFAIGLPLLACTLIGVYLLSRSKAGVDQLQILGIALAALVPASLLFGCTPTLNHQWVYPFFLLSLIPAAYLFSRSWCWIILSVIVSWNTLVLVFEVWFRDESSIYLNSSPAFIITQSSLYALFIFVGSMGRDNA
jgi:hypothetical protein